REGGGADEARGGAEGGRRGGVAFGVELVLARLVEAHAEQAGGGGHGPARVGARRAAAVAPQGAQAPAQGARGGDEGADGEQEQRRQARGREVEQVVEAGRGLAQPLVAAAVADHGVEGVGGAV